MDPFLCGRVIELRDFEPCLFLLIYRVDTKEEEKAASETKAGFKWLLCCVLYRNCRISLLQVCPEPSWRFWRLATFGEVIGRVQVRWSVWKREAAGGWDTYQCFPSFLSFLLGLRALFLSCEDVAWSSSFWWETLALLYMEQSVLIQGKTCSDKSCCHFQNQKVLNYPSIDGACWSSVHMTAIYSWLKKEGTHVRVCVASFANRTL